MISAQVFNEITVAELESIARSCGFETRPNEGRDDFWLVAHGDPTLVGPSKDKTSILFITTAVGVTTAEHVNRFNTTHGLWCSVYMNLERRHAGLIRWHIAKGATRENIAAMMFIWETYVGIFLRDFDTA